MKPKVSGAAFVPAFDECEQHGRYPINTLGAQGEVRYMVPGCPACRRQDEARRLMQQAEIPSRFQECGFDNFDASAADQQTVLATCRAYAEHFADHHARGTSLILRGGCGTGKTHLSVAIARCVMTAGFSALHVTGYALMDRIKASGFGERRTVIEQLARIDLLIVDEVGKTYGSKGELVDLFHIVDARYCKRRPTILISNESTDTIKQIIGEAAYDRLREGGGKVVNFSWQSVRGRAA
jgi:DNA replication protein DnaC